jgi:hypothetical protein
VRCHVGLTSMHNDTAEVRSDLAEPLWKSLHSILPRVDRAKPIMALVPLGNRMSGLNVLGCFSGVNA